MTPEQKSMVDKIMKLMELGKEEGNSHSAERDAANAMAAKLMAKYSIDFADLRAGKPEGMFTQFDLSMGDKKPVLWEGSLAYAIAKAFDVEVVQNRTPWILMYCGTKIDIEISVFFFNYLRRSVGIQSERKFTAAADRKTFAFAMVNEIGRRMKELYQKRNELMDNDCRALMVVKTDGLQKFVNNQFPRLRKGGTTKLTGSREALMAGIEAGKKVNISRPIGTNGTASSGQLN